MSDQCFFSDATDFAARQQEHDLEVVRNIEQSGFHVTGVFGEISFAYTTGFTELGHPELIVMHLTPEQFMPTFHDVYTRVKEGNPIPLDEHLDYLIHGLDVVFRPAGPPAFKVSTVTSRYYGDRPYSIIQLFFPDVQNHFPWEEEYNHPATQDLNLLL